MTSSITINKRNILFFSVLFACECKYDTPDKHTHTHPQTDTQPEIAAQSTEPAGEEACFLGLRP